MTRSYVKQKLAKMILEHSMLPRDNYFSILHDFNTRFQLLSSIRDYLIFILHYFIYIFRFSQLIII